LNYQDDNLLNISEKTNVSTENVSHTVTKSDAVIKSADHKKPPAPSPPEDDFEILAKRFADLKKR